MRLILFLFFVGLGECFKSKWSNTTISPFSIFLASDRPCKYYKANSGDSCSYIASLYSISVSDIEKFNKENYNWNGCDNLEVNYLVCINSGTFPKPTPNLKAECGPYAPGDLFDSKCPLNACCSQYGFCGLTSEFCENKCYSNCNYGNLHGDTSSGITLAYWMDSDGPLKYSLNNLNYDIVHYAFVNINSDFSIDDSKFLKSGFTNINAKKVASFGGWDFSTDPSTYNIFRSGVTSSNRDKLANNIANFANKYNLDGIDLDWEYPGAPDIPGIPPDDKSSGKNYLEFVKILKSKLGSKTLSMAIPSSYWYLKNFPLKDIQSYVDYFVFMTYDLYGSWDIDRDNTIKCHTNKTAVADSMKMLDKAGIEIGKTFAGIANYGRSFKASSSSCLKDGCKFSGPGNKRSISNTPGVLTESEINSIDPDSEWFEPVSQCNFIRYDEDSIVGWNKDRTSMPNFIRSHGFKGTALWAANYFNGDDDDDNDDDDELETDDTFWYEEYQRELDYIGDLDLSGDINMFDSHTCSKDPVDIYLDTETDSTCLYLRMVFEMIGPAYDAIQYLNTINRKSYNSDHQKFVNNVQKGLWNQFSDWMGIVDNNKKPEYYNEGREFYECDKETLDECIIKPVCSTLACMRLYSLKSSRRPTNFKVKESRKDDAAKSLSDLTGFNIISSNFKIFDKNTGDISRSPYDGYYVDISFKNCEFVDFNSSYINPLDTIDSDYIAQMNDILDIINRDYKESPIEAYYSMSPLFSLIDITNNMKTVKKEADKIREEEKKEKILKIISFVFMGISILAMPLGVAANLASDVASLIATTVAEYKLTGKVSADGLAFGLIGIILPFIKFPGRKLKDIFGSIDNLGDISKLNGKFKSNSKYDDIINKRIKNKIC